MAHKACLFPVKRSTTGTVPFEIPPVLLICPQIRKHRVLLAALSVPVHLHLRPMAYLVNCNDSSHTHTHISQISNLTCSLFHPHPLSEHQHSLGLVLIKHSWSLFLIGYILIHFHPHDFPRASSCSNLA